MSFIVAKRTETVTGAFHLSQYTHEGVGDYALQINIRKTTPNEFFLLIVPAFQHQLAKLASQLSEFYTTMLLNLDYQMLNVNGK